MYDTYTVTFAGHRHIDDHGAVAERLDSVIEKLLEQHGRVVFLLGREGEFDILAASSVHRAKRRYADSVTMILVLPYMKAGFSQNSDEYESYYDEVMVCGESADSHYRSAISVRNRWMAEQSDALVAYVARQSVGAYNTLCFAEKLDMEIINITAQGE